MITTDSLLGAFLSDWERIKKWTKRAFISLFYVLSLFLAYKFAYREGYRNGINDAVDYFTRQTGSTDRST